MNMKVAPPPKSAEVVSLDMAEVEFDRFCDAMDLDVDPAQMDSDDLNSFTKTKNRLLKAITDGSLMINDNGEAVYTPKKTDVGPITFHERTGASIMAMDGKKKNHQVAQMYAVMSDMTGMHTKVFANLKGIDIKICEAIFVLLMD